MNIAKRNVGSGIFFFLFSVFLYAESYNMDVSKADPIGPQMFPRVVAICIALLAVWQVIKNRRDQELTTADSESTETHRRLNIPILLTVALLIAYPLLLESAGFILLTAIYIFCQIFLLLPKGSIHKKKEVIIAAAVSVLFSLCVYFLFNKVFQIILPAGLLG